MKFCIWIILILSSVCITNAGAAGVNSYFTSDFPIIQFKKNSIKLTNAGKAGLNILARAFFQHPACKIMVAG